MNKNVDSYIENAELWKEEMIALRNILLECKLDEDFKWSKPAYTSSGTIIVVIQAFKKYFALLFYNGYLLSDRENVLQKMGEHTNTGRQIRFENTQEINKMKPIIRSYVNEAIAISSKKTK